MIAGQKLTENGVEIALFPGLQLIANPHKDYIACDFGGTDFTAPHKLIVKRNSSSAYHGVYFWTVDPVITQKHGTTHLSYLLMHDNVVSDLPVGKIIEQGDAWYQRGGFGPNGPKTYGDHIHLCVAIGHTLKTETVNGHQQLIGSVYPDQVFFINDTEIVKTSGMSWKEYIAPVVEQAQEIVEPVLVEETSPIVEPIVVEPIIEPIPVVEPIQEEPVKVEQVIDITENIAPVPVKQVVEPCDAVEQPNVWVKIIAIIIKFVLSLLKRK